jgi:hypothetical protein
MQNSPLLGMILGLICSGILIGTLMLSAPTFYRVLDWFCDKWVAYRQGQKKDVDWLRKRLHISE